MISDAVLAADLGGTNVRAAIVTTGGEVHERLHMRTPKTGGFDALVNAIGSLATGLLEKNESIRRFGLGIPAVIDFSSSRISQSPNLPVLDGSALADAVSKRTGLRVVLENDATAAAIGEHWLGAAKGADSAVCITLGTGIGGGLIINGEPYCGLDGTAGEVGHICVEPEGPRCGCGSRGCLEQYASATAIVRLASLKLADGAASVLNEKADISARDVYEAWLEKDAVAYEVFQVAGTKLGMAIADLINVLNPEIVVLTGGVASAWDAFITPTLDEMLKRAFRQPAERVKIVRGKLGDDAGILGAAKRAFSLNDKGS